MDLKINHTDLSKYTPEVLSGAALCVNLHDVIETSRRYLEMSPEDLEEELYESLRKKYEES